MQILTRPASLLPKQLRASELTLDDVNLPPALVNGLNEAYLAFNKGITSLLREDDESAILSFKQGLKDFSNTVERFLSAKVPNRNELIEDYYRSCPVKKADIQGLIDGINIKKAFILALVFRLEDFKEDNPDPSIPKIIEASLKKLNIPNEDREFVIGKIVEFMESFSVIANKISDLPFDKINEALANRGLINGPDVSGVYNEHFRSLYKGVYSDNCPEGELPRSYMGRRSNVWTDEIKAIASEILDKAQIIANTRTDSIFSSNAVSSSNIIFIDSSQADRQNVALETLNPVLAYECLEFNPEELTGHIQRGEDGASLAEIGRVCTILDNAISTYQALPQGLPAGSKIIKDHEILKALKQGLFLKKGIVLAKVFGSDTLENAESLNAGEDIKAVCTKLGCENETEREELLKKAKAIAKKMEDINLINLWDSFQGFRNAVSQIGSRQELNVFLLEGKELSTWIFEIREELKEKKYLFPGDLTLIYTNEKSTGRGLKEVVKHKSTGRRSHNGPPTRAQIFKISKNDFLAKKDAFLSDVTNYSRNKEFLQDCREVSYPNERETLVELYGRDLVDSAEPFLVFLSVCRECSGNGQKVVRISELVKGLNKVITEDSFSSEEVIGVLNEACTMLEQSAIRTDLDFGDSNQTDDIIFKALNTALESLPVEYNDLCEKIVGDVSIQLLSIGLNEVKRRLSKINITHDNVLYLNIAKAYERILANPELDGESSLTIHYWRRGIYLVPGMQYIANSRNIQLGLPEDLNALLVRQHEMNKEFLTFISENPHLHKIAINEIVNDDSRAEVPVDVVVKRKKTDEEAIEALKLFLLQGGLV